MKFFRVPDTDGEYRVTVQSLEDLWYLSRVVAPGDQVEGHSFRRFKANGGAEETGRGASGEKKPVKVRLKVESVEFAESANKLRITGVILSGSPEEFVPLGDFHTIDVEVGRPFNLFKSMSELDRQLISEAQKATSAAKAMVVVIDDEKAGSYLISARGLKQLFELTSAASKRDPATFEILKSQFYHSILEALKLHDAPIIVLAGPGFQRDTFLKYVKEKDAALAKKIITVHASSAEKSAVHELLKNGLLEDILGRQKLQEEFAALESLKKSLGKGDNMAVYGLAQVQKAVESGAASMVLVADDFLRAEPKASKLLETARSVGAQVLVYNSQDDAGAEFSAFVVAALLRYPAAY